MADYNNYSYRKLLEFFELEDRYDKGKPDSAGYLLSMSNAKSIDDMIVIYNNVLRKIAYYVYCRQDSYTWFIIESWGEKSYLARELNECLNENIERWYKGLGNPTIEDCIACIVNLRDSLNKSKIQTEITLYHHFEDLHGFAEIIDNRDSVYSIIKEIRSRNQYSPDNYLILKDQYVELMELLLSCGYKKSVIEDKFEELRGIEINKEIKKRKEKVFKVETSETKLQNGSSFWDVVIFVIIILLIIAAICLGPFGIIIFIGLLGSIPKLFLKGKF